ncbi:tripartite motif-containing protein 16-like [Erpetoichthys calabaricus]|uniref:tripartite motif-containing protein 16-like n=1 Tax=Erpetoichthys calabaricus TaxID=27687 RepID=UPI002233F4C5|nr:tripartite motif-containing protein 16-like [Erpetoichthys calabaricus]
MVLPSVSLVCNERRRRDIITQQHPLEQQGTAITRVLKLSPKHKCMIGPPRPDPSGQVLKLQFSPCSLLSGEKFVRTMSEAELFGLQNEITCFICQETLSDPVSILCGHSFCLKCLNDYWDQSHECSCPECRRTFTMRPELQRNTVLNELVKKIKKPRLSPHPSQNYAGPGDVQCDACTGMKFKAVKSCLTCMASYCPTHLQPHFEIAAWKDHKLTDPDGNLKVELCVKHQKRLEIFCKNEETYICMMCALTEHEGHKKIELEMEKAEKQKELEVTWSEIRRRLEEREKTLKETKKAEEQMKISVENELEKHEKSFTDLICSIGKTQKKLIEKIREQEKTEMEKIEGVREELEKEIEELKRKDVELRELSETKDNNCFLQTFQSHGVLPAEGDSLSFTVTENFSSEVLKKKLSCVKKSLEKISQWDIVTWTPSGREASVFTLQPPEPRSRDEFLQYFCPLTLDINTAHRELHLSEGNKKVTHDDWTITDYPDHPDRFDWSPQVLCREGLTGARCYWEVECNGLWIDIGVAYKGLRRKGVV